VKTVTTLAALLLLACVATACGEGNPLAQSAPSTVLTPALARVEKNSGAVPSAIIWGEGVKADNIMWGEKAPVAKTDNILWGDKAPAAKTQLIIWGESVPNEGDCYVDGDLVVCTVPDGNNGHGNNDGQFDPSNPGKGGPKSGTQFDPWGYDPDDRGGW